MQPKNQIMLITYPDSLGGDLKGLQTALETQFPGVAGSLHILPFFPSSCDRGFAPTTYDTVEPAFGDWGDIERLSRSYDLMCDMMVNHISRQSREFRDFLEKGRRSEFSPMFLRYEDVFGGEPSAEQLAMLYRRGDKVLYQDVALADGTTERLWCSFAAEQIDLDTDQPMTRAYIRRTLEDLSRHGLSVVRLDAYGYTTKVAGTNCFFVEPKVWDLIGEIEKTLEAQDMMLLPEVHAEWQTALNIASHGYWTYDFVLPLLMLSTLYSGNAASMKKWFSVCPRTQFTVLDTHDGVGVGDADGFVTEQESDRLIAQIEDRLSYAYKPMDPTRRKHRRSYQLYGTYYSMLHEEDNTYLLARALQFFAPGVPQVYYVGMLAGSNDLSFDGADPRNINRRNYTAQELAAEAERPVVQRLTAMMRLRNTHPAFAGELQILDTPDSEIHLVRQAQGEQVELHADVRAKTWTLRYTSGGRTLTF